MEMSGDLVEDNKTEESQEEQVPQQLKGKKLSWQKLRRYDSLDIESSSVRGHHGHGSKVSPYSKLINSFDCLILSIYLVLNRFHVKANRKA
jgi:hypothetical protein